MIHYRYAYTKLLLSFLGLLLICNTYAAVEPFIKNDTGTALVNKPEVPGFQYYLGLYSTTFYKLPTNSVSVNYEGRIYKNGKNYTLGCILQFDGGKIVNIVTTGYAVCKHDNFQNVFITLELPK